MFIAQLQVTFAHSSISIHCLLVISNSNSLEYMLLKQFLGQKFWDFGLLENNVNIVTGHGQG